MTPSGCEHDDGIERISDVLGRLRVLIGRRVISRMAIANVAPGVELSAIDVLALIPGGAPEAGQPPQQPQHPQGITVGAVAQAMRIDPSRASRLVSQMVERGLLSRVASPGDARSCLIVRTDLGQRLHQEMLQVKRRLIDGALEDWAPEEIATFAAQFDRFISQWERQIAEDDQKSGQDRA